MIEIYPLVGFSKKDVNYIKNCSRARPNIPGEAGPFPY